MGSRVRLAGTIISISLLSACGGGGGGGGNSSTAIQVPIVQVPIVQAPVTQPSSCALTPLGEKLATKKLISHGMNYPATVRSLDDPSQVLIFTGDFAYKATATMLRSTPKGDASHIRYGRAQEELWAGRLDATLSNWQQERFYVIGIQPDTQVSNQAAIKYDTLYPTGFSKSCYEGFQDGQCNVQINDATVITHNVNGEPHYLLYFTLFENYRWHSDALGGISAAGPSNPERQNIHAIGLALSTDGANWSFFDKVISESELDSDGNPILGAWSPSAISNPDTGIVDIYFHDALGTKQYVARLDHGVDKLAIERLNPDDAIYRTNLDILKRNGKLEVMYNNPDFDIIRTGLNTDQKFDAACNTEAVELAPGPQMFPTPHQLLDDQGRLYVYYWDFHADEEMLINIYD